MQNKENSYAAGFFKKGNVIKCHIDSFNLKRLKEVVNSLQEGDEFVLFERTEKSKQKSLEDRGTPIEKQPTHNLTRVTAEEAKKNREEWLASRTPTSGV